MENKIELNTEPKMRSTDATPQSPARGTPVGSPLLRSDPSAAAIPTPQSVEILIVEDSAVEAEMLRRILVRSGYRVTLAKNGEEGLQALRGHPCALVISDVNMPVMNGYELCHAIKYDEKLWATPVMLVTSLAEPKDIIKALDVGADGYITKPYVEDILLGRLRSLLANPATRKLAEERRKINVEYDGESYSVAVGSPQMANLLLSVYENSLVLNQELMRIQNQLTMLNETLDDKVRERTAVLAENEEKFRTAIDVVLDAYIIIEGEHGTITWWNSAAEAMFGYSKQEMIGRSLHEIIVPPRFHDAAQHGLAHFSTTGEGAAINKTLELAALRKNGAEFPIELSLSAMQLNGKWHAIGIVRDITERKQAEAKLNEQLNDLHRWQEAMTGREMRTLELKREVNKLLAQAGQPPRYLSVAAEGSLRSSGEPTGVPLAGEQSSAE